MFTAIRRDRRRYGSVAAGQSLFNPEASLFPEPRELSLQLRRPCDKGSDAEKDGEVRLPPAARMIAANAAKNANILTRAFRVASSVNWRNTLHPAKNAENDAKGLQPVRIQNDSGQRPEEREHPVALFSLPICLRLLRCLALPKRSPKPERMVAVFRELDDRHCPCSP
jgi:hypothetical protein